jgi:hypothetical protein
MTICVMSPSQVPAKQPKRGRGWDNDGSCVRPRPEHRNHVWSYDFVEVTAQGVNQHGPLPHKKIPHLVEHQHRLLIPHLDGDNAYGRPSDAFRDRLRVGCIGLAALDVGLHVGRRHQLDGMAELRQLAPQ